MNKPTIQFHKTDFNELDSLLKSNYSLGESSFDIYLERQMKPLSWAGNYIWGSIPENIPWIILEKNSHKKIGEIIYQEGPEFDSMIFDYKPEFNKVVLQFINELVNNLEFFGFGEILRITNLNDAYDFAQYKKKKQGHPGLSREEWADRIEKVIDGKELKENNPSLTWKQILGKVEWSWGDGFDSKYKLFQYARQKIDRLEYGDPEGILDLVKQRKRMK